MLISNTAIIPLLESKRPLQTEIKQSEDGFLPPLKYSSLTHLQNKLLVF